MGTGQVRPRIVMIVLQGASRLLLRSPALRRRRLAIFRDHKPLIVTGDEAADRYGRGPEPGTVGDRTVGVSGRFGVDTCVRHSGEGTALCRSTSKPSQVGGRPARIGASGRGPSMPRTSGNWTCWGPSRRRPGSRSRWEAMDSAEGSLGRGMLHLLVPP